MNDLNHDSRFGRAEIAGIAAASALLVLSSFFTFSGTSLRRYWMGWEELGPGTPIGKLEASAEGTRRRLKQESVFGGVRAGALLFSRDTLVTAAQGTAKVLLDDGTQIGLGPSTLIELQFESKLTLSGIARRAVVEVVTGAATATRSRKRATDIQSPVREVVLKAGPRVIQIREEAAPVRLDSADILRQPAEPEPPRPEDTPTPNASPTPPSPAHTSPGASPIPSPSPSPSPCPSPRPTSAPSPSPTSSPTPRPSSKASPRPLPTLQLHALKLNGRTATQSGEFKGSIPSRLRFRFKWEPIPEAARYIVHIQELSGPKGPEVRLETETDQLEWNPPIRFRGSWKYEVEAKLEDRRAVRSSGQGFSVLFDAPEIVNPADRVNVHRLTKDGKPAEILFTWQKSPAASRYEIEISTGVDFKQPLVQEMVEDNFYIAKEMGVGTYFWRVNARDRDKIPTAAGKARMFQVIP